MLKGNFITQGKKIDEFEKLIAQKTGAKYAVVFSSGTAALHSACFAGGIEKEDEVITTPITFCASANCVLYCGGTPVFADINPETYNIDIKSIKKKISNKTKAIIPVHFTGQPCEMDMILKIADKYGLTVIEDGAHALGAKYHDKKIGSIGDMTVFSFHPVKHITTGEGGAVTTNDRKIYEKLLKFRTHGITKKSNSKKALQEPWYYRQEFLGYNYRLTDIQAALGISQLKKLDMFVKKRLEIAKMYNEAFESVKEIVIPKQIKGASSSWHIYVIQLKLEALGVGRKEIFDELKEKGLGVNVHYIPVYYHPHYKELGYKKGICPNAEQLYERIITIPLFPKMSKKDIEYVIKSVKSTVKKYRK